MHPQWERVFDARMTSQGSAYARFTRALERARTTGNPQLAWIAATELRHVALEDALALVLVARSDARFERGAAKWVARLTLEGPGIDLARLQLAAAALRATPDPLALQTLAALCEELGLAGSRTSPSASQRPRCDCDPPSRPLARQERRCATLVATGGQPFAAPTTREGQTPRFSDRRGMNQLAHLAHLRLDDMPLAHRLALAAGAGVWMAAEEERISTAHELVALAVPVLVRLRIPALLADAASEPAAGFAELACESAGALRLLDRALLSHGRDHGYVIERWYEHAHVAADVAIHGLGLEGALGARVDDAARMLGGVVIGLHRDRLAVPENLAAAIGTLLVVYLAARPTRPLAGEG